MSSGLAGGFDLGGQFLDRFAIDRLVGNQFFALGREQSRMQFGLFNAGRNGNRLSEGIGRIDVDRSSSEDDLVAAP